MRSAPCSDVALARLDVGRVLFVCLFVLKKGLLSRVKTHSHQSGSDGCTQREELSGEHTPNRSAHFVTPSGQAQRLFAFPPLS